MIEYKGEKFRRFLKRINCSVTEAAKLMGVSRQNMYQLFESTELERKTVNIILTKFGANEYEIFGDEDDFFRPMPEHLTKNNGIPMYNVPATASVVGVFEDDMSEKPLFYLDVPGARDCDFGVRVSGDSMYPRFRNGDWIGCKEVKNREHILYGEVYYIITPDYKTVKYVQPHPSKEDWVLLIPHNESIKPTPLPKSEIIRLYMVKVNLQIF